MTGRSVVVWDDALLAYDPGRGHPLRAVRLRLTMSLARSLGLLDRDGVSVVPPVAATDEELLRVHGAAYVEAVRAAHPSPEHGLGEADNPVFDGLHEASALVTGGTLVAARAVWAGPGVDAPAVHAASIAGGLHHAHRDRAAGFCVYCDPAVAIAALLDAGAQRVAYVDVDAHHGDGVAEAFVGDPRVLTISLHQNGITAYPGTGFPEDVGDGEAEGTDVNVALPPYTGDAGFLRAVSGVVPVLLRAFAPDVLVTQGGCDGHRDDPMSDLCLSVDGLLAVYAVLHDLAHEVCAGRWVALGGGGYDLYGAVPRAWTGLLALVTGDALDPSIPLPEAWREQVRELSGTAAPERLGDGEDASYSPWDAGIGDVEDSLDRCVAATRDAVLPLHGLDPWRDR